jgi:sulfoquinovose isomerase
MSNRPFLSKPAKLSPAAWSELVDLTRFAAAARRSAGGFGELDARGDLAPASPAHPLQTARMTFTFSIAHQLGVPGSDDLAAHGVAALSTLLRDHLHGGTILEPAHPDGPKSAYLATFAALAASAAARADVPGAPALAAATRADLAERFWSEEEGALIDEWDAGFSRAASYRGANANMHGVEAFCAIGAETGDPVWFERATRIATRLIDGIARSHGWMLPEHFTEEWVPLLDYNRESPGDEFRPYGVTVGHLLEWSRLLLELHSETASSWMPDASRGLYETAKRVGWHADGRPGFVYTVDWEGNPVVRTRPHWVALEGVAAAATQAQAFGRSVEDDDRAAFSDYAEAYLRDREHGSWHHELDEENRPIARTWRGKPDAYHALGALLVPELPIAPGLSERLQRSAEDDKNIRRGRPAWSLA